MIATFRYVLDPQSSTASTWTEGPRECEICGSMGPGYEGPYFGREDIDFVCEDCVVAGLLAERGIRTNSGDAGPTNDRRAEREHRTPNLVSWQDFFWPMHCDDFCCFEREVGRRELDELSTDDGVAYLNAHLADDLREFHLDEDELPHRGPAQRGESNDPAIYQFACVVCGTHVFRWDAS